MSGLPRIEKTITESIEACDIPKRETRKSISIEFKKITFEKECQPTSPLKLKNITFKNCIFSKQIIKEIVFLDCVFVECEFNGACIVDCEFHRCQFRESLFYKTKAKGTYLDPLSFSFSPKWHYRLANVNAWWFQVLYRNSKEIYQDTFAMNADKRFQFYRRYEYLLGNKKRPFSFLFSLFYDIGMDYGYGVLNSLIVTILWISLFAFLIHMGTTAISSNLIEQLYFAMVSFTTVGYGDITPKRETFALIATSVFLFLSFVWGTIVTAVIVKRLVK